MQKYLGAFLTNGNLIVKALTLLIFLFVILSNCAEDYPLNLDSHRNIFLVDYINLPNPKAYMQGKLCRWRNQDCLIYGGKIYRVDARKLKITELPLPEKFDSVVHLELSQDKRLMVVSWKKTGNILFIEDGDNWKTIPLPINFRARDAACINLAARGDKAAFQFGDKFYFWDGKNWLDKSSPNDRDRYYTDKLLIGDNEIYMAINKGSFHGGTLGIFDINIETLEKITDDAVTNFDFDSSGNLWFLTDGLFAGLLRLEIDKPVGQCGVNFIAPTGTGITKCRKNINWPFGCSYFATMTMCDDDSILLGTFSQGVFRYKDGKAVKLVSGWNKESELTSVLQLENGKIGFTANHEGLGIVKENCSFE
ncbi:MAG: hypothetical protein KIT34_05310 [Cyanobacteria bacterium TGS_CYA1]|nr:hypothetical protein [Cyanobacteria bacterium TGS_CYA1]